MQQQSVDQNPFLRFADLYDVSKMASLDVLLVGAGGIGAPTALCLAKAGVHKLCVYDFDRVDYPNVGTQMYGPSDVGSYKVDVLHNSLLHHAPWCEVEPRRERWEGQSLQDFDIVIGALDNLETRRHLWDTMVEEDLEGRLMVDPRMGALALSVYAARPDYDRDAYEKTYEGTPSEELCTAKATFYTGFAAGAVTAQTVTAFVQGDKVPFHFMMDLREIKGFSLPF